MQTNLILCIIVAVSLILCPVAALGSRAETPPSPVAVTEKTEEEYISVMSQMTGKINKIGMREYIIGCVAAEMPAVYHTEALRAQAVASYTYAKKTLEQNKKSKNSLLGGADITDSPDMHQGYIDRNERKEKWGEKFEEYEKKISSAVDDVFGCYLEYNGETVLAVYHSISAGSTQSAENLWGSEIPYLISVESQGDRLSPDYIGKSVFDESEFRSLAKDCGIRLSGDADEWVEDVEINNDGYVRAIVMGGKEVASSKFRDVYSLRSQCFDIEYADGKFTVTCKGHGHGAGMSQYGSDYMARQGFKWHEILAHYYVNTEICEDE